VRAAELRDELELERSRVLRERQGAYALEAAIQSERGALGALATQMRDRLLTLADTGGTGGGAAAARPQSAAAARHAPARGAPAGLASEPTLSAALLARCADLEDALRARDTCLHRLAAGTLNARGAVRAAQEAAQIAEEAAAVLRLAGARARAFADAAHARADSAGGSMLAQLAASCVREAETGLARAREVVGKLRVCDGVAASPELRDPGDEVRRSTQPPAAPS
jgi:hypothetical protein